MTRFTNRLLSVEATSEDWKRSTMVPVYKENGNVLDCRNYRGINLFEHGLNIYERILDKRLRQYVDVDVMNLP